MSLLHIDSSILGGNSVSRSLSAAVVARLRAATPGLHVTYRDLAASPVSHLSGAYLAGQSAEVQHDQAMQEDLRLGGEVLEEFLAADIVVIGVALYNFTVSSQLKAWVDRVLVAGKTFRYGEKGAEGLAGGKRVILAVARGRLLRAGHAPPGLRARGELHADRARLHRHPRSRGRRGRGHRDRPRAARGLCHGGHGADRDPQGCLRVGAGAASSED
jgi:FMN-dependent NADH-azoreductase